MHALALVLFACGKGGATGGDSSGGAPEQLLVVEASEHAGTAFEACWPADAADTLHATLPSGATTSWVVQPAGGDQSCLTLLVRAGLEVELALERQDGQPVDHPPVALSASALPEGLPTPTVLQHATEGSYLGDGALALATVSGRGSSHVMLFDARGEVLLARELDDPDQHYLAVQRALDGEGLLVTRVASDRDSLDLLASYDDNRLERLSWSGELLESWILPGQHHYIDQPAVGQVAWLAATAVEVEGEDHPVVFEEIHLLDLESGEDSVLADTRALEYSRACEVPGYWGPYCDGQHGNSLRCQLEADVCTLSLTGTHDVVRLSLSGSELLASFKDWSYQPLDGGGELAFEFPHDLHELEGDRLLLFNDGFEGGYATELTLDHAEERLVQTWRHPSEDCAIVDALGAVVDAGPGHRLVSFGTPSARLHEVDIATGEITWSASMEPGGPESLCERTDEPEVTIGQVVVVHPDSLAADVAILTDG